MSGIVVGWFGYGGHSHMAERYREDLMVMGHTLKTCHEYPNADFPYAVETIHEFIDSCDVMILPSRHRIEPAKSVNRLALAWSRGKPCIISPLDSYLKYARDGENALIAETPERFLTHIATLAKDEALRKRLGEVGKVVANTMLHPRHQVEKFFTALREVDVGSPWKPDTFVQIIIPHYADRTDYLLQATKAALSSWGPARDILIISSSKTNPTRGLLPLQKNGKWPSNFRLHHQTNRLTFSQANNMGIKAADARTTHYLLLNDDTILSNKALGRMFAAIGDKHIILNPYSNCDKGWLHNDDLKIDTLPLVPNMAIENLKVSEPHRGQKIREFDPSQDKTLIPTDFAAMYCTLIPKPVLDRVGYLDTNFQSGGEDADYCYRAKRYGFESFWTKSAFCFHYGGKTRKQSEDEDHDRHHREDRHNNSLLRWKWKGKRVAIWTGAGLEKWDLESWKTKGLGGSETCAARLVEAATKAGCSATLYGDPAEPIWQNDVRVLPWNHFQPEEEYYDLFIASREIGCIDDRLRARRILVWVHDIWLMSGQAISDYHRARVDKFICLSPWHKQYLSDHHKLPPDQIEIIPNGVNIEVFQNMV